MAGVAICVAMRGEVQGDAWRLVFAMLVSRGVEYKMVDTRLRIRGVGVLGGGRGPKERVGLVMEDCASV